MQNSVHAQCSREKSCRLHCVFLGDYDPKKIKNLSLTRSIFLILSSFCNLIRNLMEEDGKEGPWWGLRLQGSCPTLLCTHYPGLIPAVGTHGLKLRL